MIIELHESKKSLEQILSTFKEISTTNKIWYKKIDKDISSLLLEAELPVKKLKIIINHLKVDDYVKDIIQGNEHIALFGKRIHAHNLLIGIATRRKPIPPYIFLNISAESLTFPYQRKMANYEYQTKGTKKTTKESDFPKRRL